MSDTPETIAAILADYRADITAMTSGELPHPTPEYLRILLDRIEASAERKRASLEDALTHCREYAEKIERENEEGETRLDAEEIIATVDNEFAGIRPERVTGNADALREALVEILDRTNREKARDYDAALKGGILEIHDIANVALNQTKGE